MAGTSQPGVARDRFHKHTSATAVATSQVVTSTPTIMDAAASFNCARNGSVAVIADWEDVETSATVATLSFYFEFCTVPVADAVAGDWMRETEEDSNGAVTKKTRTLAAASFSDGDQFIMADLKVGSYHGIRMYLSTDAGTSTISVWMAGGAE